ncbi:MAG: 2-oxoacid:acceptor oxidoreductase family protein [Ignavibacteriales bacterium]|nr:2-oxoacid:acceptor oxidoreductase family protein [Ignavibacteriales bacterium]
MTKEILFAGFGGQGVLSMGMTLAYAGMIEQKEVSWMPSYGPEMRGGTANCIVIISDKPVSSPIVTRFDVVVALNQPSIDKFQKAVKPGGIMMYDIDSAIHPPTRTDILLVSVEADKLASQLKNLKVKNMILLGAFLGVTEIVEIPSVIKALKQVLPERYHNMLDINQQALETGKESVAENTLLNEVLEY